MTDEVDNLPGLQAESGQPAKPQATGAHAADGPIVATATGKLVDVTTARRYNRQVWIIMLYYVILLIFSIWFVLDAFSGKFTLIGLFGVDMSTILDENAAQLKAIAFTVVGGFLGSALYGIRTLFNVYAKGEKEYDPRWLPKYFTLPWEGAGLSIVVLALFRGGVAAFGGSVATDPSEVNNFTTFATGALVGYGTRDVVGWLGGIVSSMFPEQADSDRNSDDVEPEPPPSDEAG
jgi:hypothetical protein